MHGAGVRERGGPVETLDLPDPRALADDEVLIEVRAAGVGNWDEIVRVGDWDVGAAPPMALGVEVAGRISAVGAAVDDWAPADDVLTHPLPLRQQGTWAERVIAPAALLASKPATVEWPEAAAFAVPALTAEQVLSEALALQSDEWLLVHGGGSVTGGILVALAAERGAHVVATAGPRSADRVRRLGARHVLDYRDGDWSSRAVASSGGRGFDAAANAAGGGEDAAVRAVRDGGRLATITGAPPQAERGLSVANVYVRPDGEQLRRLAAMLGDGRLSVHVGAVHPFARAAEALDAARDGTAGGAVVLVP